MKQLCDDLRQFAIEVRQLGYSLDGGAGYRECLNLSERMFAAVKQAETRMAADQLARRGPTKSHSIESDVQRAAAFRRAAAERDASCR
jgi:hypothetical protein